MSNAKDLIGEMADKAFRRMVKKVRAENKRFGLPLIYLKDGKIVRERL